jgi:ATP-binding cassette subfamily B protein
MIRRRIGSVPISTQNKPGFMSVKIKQRDLTDCGAACLASVAAHYKHRLPVARVRQLAGTGVRGTNVAGMIEAAEKIGFEAQGVKGKKESLPKIPLPAIAHLTVQDNKLHHFVVICRAHKKNLVYMDPADGKKHRETYETFEKKWTGVLILLQPSRSFTAGDETISRAGRFLHLLRPHKAVLAQVLTGAVVYTLLGLSTAIYMQKITDNVLTEENMPLMNLLTLGMILILILQIAVGVFRSVFTVKTGQQIDLQLILGYYKHLLRLPQQFFDGMRTGEIISRINDAVKIRTFINEVAVNLIVNALIILFSFALMFTYYWKLALCLLIVIPLYCGIYFVANRFNARIHRKLMENSADLEAQLVESVNAAGTIKRFGLEEFADLKTEILFTRLLKSSYRASMNNVFTANATQFSSRLFAIILLWAGAGFVIGQQLTPGELLSFYALVGYFTGPMESLISSNRQFQEARIAADRLFEIMDLQKEENGEKVRLTREMIGDIRFEQVCFRYGSRTPVFRELTIHIKKGSVTAVVGESGSGKSTLISLLQYLYPLQKGHIYIGAQDIQYLDNNTLRQLVSVVPQQIDLFAGDIIENIAVGDLEPDWQRILEICGQLGLLPFIEKLPNGFHTFLGENGATLSGGQKQKLAIARALYRDPEILIMDEATSSLDAHAEHEVQQTIHHLRGKGKTIILIAHRLSTVMHADQIYVLKKGELVGQGTHHELMAEQGDYYRLWKRNQVL